MSPMGEAEAYGVQPDSVAALRWLEAAAQQEHGDAMTLVAYAYELGLGTEVNPATAARWWRRLAERGDADAMHRLGTIARIGRMLPQAAHWFRAAAARGDMLALRYLRELAAEGVAEAALDPAEELAMLEAAAAAGDVVAIETLELRLRRRRRRAARPGAGPAAAAPRRRRGARQGPHRPGRGGAGPARGRARGAGPGLTAARDRLSAEQARERVEIGHPEQQRRHQDAAQQVDVPGRARRPADAAGAALVGEPRHGRAAGAAALAHRLSCISSSRRRCRGRSPPGGSARATGSAGSAAAAGRRPRAG
jgi:hypothetical protein